MSGYFENFQLNFGGVDARTQAQKILDKALQTHQETGRRVGIIYSANRSQTEHINAQGQWTPGIFRGGANQAQVMQELENLLQSDPRYQSLRGNFGIMPLTTMTNDSTSFQPRWIDEDLNRIKDFMNVEGGVVLGWQNERSSAQLPYAVGGGVAAQRPGTENIYGYPNAINQVQNGLAQLAQNFPQPAASAKSTQRPVNQAAHQFKQTVQPNNPAQMRKEVAQASHIIAAAIKSHHTVPAAVKNSHLSIFPGLQTGSCKIVFGKENANEAKEFAAYLKSIGLKASFYGAGEKHPMNVNGENTHNIVRIERDFDARGQVAANDRGGFPNDAFKALQHFGFDQATASALLNNIMEPYLDLKQAKTPAKKLDAAPRTSPVVEKEVVLNYLKAMQFKMSDAESRLNNFSKDVNAIEPASDGNGYYINMGKVSAQDVQSNLGSILNNNVPQQKSTGTWVHIDNKGLSEMANQQMLKENISRNRP